MHKVPVQEDGVWTQVPRYTFDSMRPLKSPIETLRPCKIRTSLNMLARSVLASAALGPSLRHLRPRLSEPPRCLPRMRRRGSYRLLRAKRSTDGVFSMQDLPDRRSEPRLDGVHRYRQIAGCGWFPNVVSHDKRPAAEDSNMPRRFLLFRGEVSAVPTGVLDLLYYTTKVSTKRQLG